MTRVFVSGASGFIGAHVSKYLLERGDDVVSIKHDERTYDTPKLLGINEDITWTKGDILDNTFVKRVIADYEIEDIYHFAALVIVRVAGRSPVPVYQTNIMGTVNILEAARENNSNVIVTSTDKVFGDAGDVPYKENMPLNGYGAYESSKACQDIITRSYHYEFGVKSAVVRPSNIYGEADTNSRLIPNTIRKLLRNERAVVFKNINYIREFTYIDDITNGLYLIMKNIPKLTDYSSIGLDENNQRDRSAVASALTFNIGSGEYRTQEGVINEIRKHFPGSEVEYKDPMPYMRKEIPYQRLDSTKIQKLLGWKPKVSFEDGIRRTVEWWSDNPSYWNTTF